ncbi:MAG: hypothetical protein QM619_09180 [Micropruina sp.]|uniref:hypothetical protein n=1 Tax=Micropruina sp. TaxID=2737536 RepID=UPI0039E34F7D
MVNPTAGRGRARRILPALARALRAAPGADVHDGLIGSRDGEALGDVPLRVTAVSDALCVLG